mmetsp:Transcript_10006/g.29690  ORF Transcript_10006/g.29690 Transcript_10006/m.29690 type:complete len:280 (+) Transcript_10006:1096-1935(+)
MVVTRNEPRDVRGRQLHERVVGVDARDALDALVNNRVAHVDAAVRPAHALLEYLVHLLRGLLVGGAQDAQDGQQLHLQPRRRHPMVVEVPRQSMLGDLLEDADERRDQVFAALRVGLGHLEKDVQRGTHDRRVRVAQDLPDLVLLVEDDVGVELVESVHGNDRLLANHLLLMRQELEDQRGDGRDHLDVHQTAHRCQCGADLDVVGALQIPLHGVNEEQHELVILVQEQIGGEVTDPLRKQAFLVGQLDSVDVGEACIVPQHLTIHSPNHVLLHLLGRD